MSTVKSTRSESVRRVMEKRWAGRREFWREIISRQEAGGLSITAFCKEEGIHTTSFYSWRRRLQEKAEPAKAQSPGFVPLEFSTAGENEAGCGISVVVGVGVCLHLDKGFSADELLRAVNVLRSL